MPRIYYILERSSMKKRSIFSILVGVAVGAIAGIVVNHFASAFIGVDLMRGSGGGQEFNNFIYSLTTTPLSLNPNHYLLSFGVFVGVVILCYILSDPRGEKQRKNKLKGNEYGSARWATTKEMKDFKASNPLEDFILSENASISIPAIKKTKTQQLLGGGTVDRNKHIFVCGGSGSGKTFNVVGPNLLQAQYSFISTDPKGDTVSKYGQFLLNQGYKLKIINTKDTESFPFSAKYNPFHYITDQASIMNLVSIIIENTSGSDDSRSSEDFWIKSERCLYMCLIGFIFYFYKDYPEYQTIPVMLDLINLASASEQDESATSPLDIVMQEFEDELVETYGSIEQAKIQPEWFVITQYSGFKKAAGETAKSIIISCFVRLSPFSIGVVRDMFSADELELDKLGEEKTALFFVMSDTNSTFNFIMAMIFYQLFDINVKKADASPGSHCKIPIMCILDEMANIGRIPDLEIKIATLRSRWINLVPIVQNTAQLDSVYGKEKALTIKANCDTFLYLGRADYATCEEISKKLGKETIEVKSTSKQKNGTSVSTQKIARDLMTADELDSNPEKFSPDDCLVMIKMAHPFKDKKFMLFNHPNYPKLEEAGELDIERYTMNLRADEYRAQKKDQSVEDESIQEEITNIFAGINIDNIYMAS